MQANSTLVVNNSGGVGIVEGRRGVFETGCGLLSLMRGREEKGIRKGK